MFKCIPVYGPVYSGQCSNSYMPLELTETNLSAKHNDGLMVSALDSGASGLGSSPGRGHCVVFLGKTLNSHGASLHPGV